jgi:hypothetical protein
MKIIVRRLLCVYLHAMPVYGKVVTLCNYPPSYTVSETFLGARHHSLHDH